MAEAFADAFPMATRASQIVVFAVGIFFYSKAGRTGKKQEFTNVEMNFKHDSMRRQE
jgi:hypothetical protein